MNEATISLIILGGFIGIPLTFWIFSLIFNFIRFMRTTVNVGDRFKSVNPNLSPWHPKKFETATVLQVNDGWVKYDVRDATGKIVSSTENTIMDFLKQFQYNKINKHVMTDLERCDYEIKNSVKL